MNSRHIVIRVGRGNLAQKAMESEAERAPAPTSERFQSFLVSHNGKNLSHGIAGLKNPIRFNSIRVAQALKRRGVGEISAADFYRVARGRGVSAEELAWGGLHPAMHEHLPAMTPQQWQAHIGRHMPEFKMEDQAGYGAGMFGNRMLHDYIDQGGHGNVMSHQLSGDPLHIVSRQWRPYEGHPEVRGSVSLTMRDPLDPRSVHDKARHFRTGGHGSPHILSYKAFEHQSADGHRALVIEQVQSDQHQNKSKSTGTYVSHKDDVFDEVRRQHLADDSGNYGMQTSADGRPILRLRNSANSRVVDAPFGHADNGQWENLALRMALHNAARQGFDSIALPHSTWQNGHVGRSFGDLESHVVRRNGTTLPREAAKIVRSLSDFGVTSQVRRFEPFNQDLTHLIITPELRSHLLHNGLTLWDSDNPRDMHRAIKAVEQAPERAPAPTSPEFSGFLSRHDGLPQRAKLSPESQRRVENPFRFNSIRVAQALERRGAGPMSAADFYRNATGRGVSKEELAWGGLHPSQHDSLADRTPAEWRQHIERNLPIFHAQDQNGMNNGMLLNFDVDNWVRDHGATDPVQHSIYNDVNDRYVYGKADMGPRLAGVGTAVSIGMTDLRHGGREANQIRHDSIQGHGEPHVLSYKAFGWHPKGINSPGEDHLIIDQLQSDWHQKKDLWNKYDPFFYNHEHPKFHDARMRVHENTLEEFPDYPFGRHGQWENVAIRHALYNAAMQGYDSLGLPPSESPYWHNGSLNYQNDYEPDYWSDNYAHLSNRYGIVVPQQVDRIVRELSDLGVHTFQRKFEPTGQMLTHIKITPELREHFMKHGMTLWESDNPRDMHRAIKAIKVRRGGVRTG